MVIHGFRVLVWWRIVGMGKAIAQILPTHLQSIYELVFFFSAFSFSSYVTLPIEGLKSCYYYD